MWSIVGPILSLPVNDRSTGSLHRPQTQTSRSNTSTGANDSPVSSAILRLLLPAKSCHASLHDGLQNLVLVSLIPLSASAKNARLHVAHPLTSGSARMVLANRSELSFLTGLPIRTESRLISLDRLHLTVSQ
jgi:hypothetical protein